MLLHRHYLWVMPALLMAVVLCPLPAGWSMGWRGELLNRMHAPLMAAAGFLASLCLGFQRRKHTFAAVTITLIAAAVIELVQPWFGRTASLGDLGWGMIGAASVLIWHLGTCMTGFRQRRCLTWLAALVALAPPTSWWMQIIQAQQDTVSHFPVLLAPAIRSANLLWQVSPTFRDNEDVIILARDIEHPASARLDVMEKDWSAFSGLELKGEFQGPAELPLGVRLDMTDAPTNRIRTGASLLPGNNNLRIFWPDGAQAVGVKQLVLFLDAGTPPAHLRILSVRLIKKGR
jgi:hypothetical protein